jgi:hypothetical protein
MKDKQGLEPTLLSRFKIQNSMMDFEKDAANYCKLVKSCEELLRAVDCKKD